MRGTTQRLVRKTHVSVMGRYAADVMRSLPTERRLMHNQNTVTRSAGYASPTRAALKVPLWPVAVQHVASCRAESVIGTDYLDHGGRGGR